MFWSYLKWLWPPFWFRSKESPKVEQAAKPISPNVNGTATRRPGTESQTTKPAEPRGSPEVAQKSNPQKGEKPAARQTGKPSPKTTDSQKVNATNGKPVKKVGEGKVSEPEPQTETVPERGNVTGELRYRAVLRRAMKTHKFPANVVNKHRLVGNGGEARVYQVSQSAAWKIFRTPEDDYYRGDEDDQISARKSARERLLDYPTKLAVFPPWVGSRVIGPEDLLDFGGTYQIAGYVMPFLENAVPLSKFMDSDWKTENAIGITDIAEVFLDLFDTLHEVHACGMIIGDFKPENILVVRRNKRYCAYIVDSESMAYGPYRCRTFTDNYVDPRLCDPEKDVQVLVKPYDRTSDWYAYVVMLFQAVTNLHPYEGAYFPPKGKPIIKPQQRALKGISVFNPHVKLPGFTQRDLPEPLKPLFYNMFESGMRERPRRSMIESLLPKERIWEFDPAKHLCWKQYEVSTEAKAVTPGVAEYSVLGSAGQIVVAANHSEEHLSFLYRDGENLVRESGKVIVAGEKNRLNFLQVSHTASVVGSTQTKAATGEFTGPFYHLVSGKPAKKIMHVDKSPEGNPNIAIQGNNAWWFDKGKLYRSDAAHEILSIEDNVRYFSGNRFGIIITSNSSELLDIFLQKENSVLRLHSLPPILGKILVVDCTFAEDVAWLFISAQWNGKVTRYILVLKEDGDLLGLGVVHPFKSSWHSRGIPRVAHTVDDDGKKIPELVAILGARVVRIRVYEQKIVPTSVQSLELPGKISCLVLTSSGLRIAVQPEIAPNPETPSRAVVALSADGATPPVANVPQGDTKNGQ